ncbi:hypothetical protein JQX13_11800 [Archangium violaceum]|uniref:hypothetical protein n=1 Tax=Archangium violaceum TaxID=83451 RepID=UPI00193B747C|nr:hypothetical protein [Archangium violaceum]QRK10693.1 hypothetical protein JQX13_11800 [Archangium violaceum]
MVEGGGGLGGECLFLDGGGGRGVEVVEAVFRLSTYCADPEGLGADAAVAQFQVARRGVMYLDGGWSELVNGLAAVAGASEVEVVTSARVESVERDEGGPRPGVRGLRLADGTEYEAGASLTGFLEALVSGDTEAAEALLAEPVRALTDGGGETYSARVPVVGLKRVALFCRRVFELRGTPDTVEWRMLNGLPALVVGWHENKPGRANRAVIRVDVDAEGRITESHLVQTSRKLAGPRPTG